MGLFKAFKKLGKSLFKGISKVFALPTKLLSKVVGKKWAKRLMIAAAVFTGGMALLSGVGGFLGGTGFFGRFVSGGQSFVKGLFNPVGAAKGLAHGLGATKGAGLGIGGIASTVAQTTAAGAGGAFAPMAAVGAGAGAAAAPAAAPTAGAAAGAAAPAAGAAAPAAGAGAGAAAAGTAAQNLTNPGFLSKAANFAMSPGGGMLLSGAAQGYAQGKAAEAHQDRLDENSESKQDPESVGMYQDAINQDLGALPRFRQEMDRRMERIRNRGRNNYNTNNDYAVA